MTRVHLPRPGTHVLVTHGWQPALELNQALLQSQSGRRHGPTESVMLIAVRRRLRLPLPLGAGEFVLCDAEAGLY